MDGIYYGFEINFQVKNIVECLILLWEDKGIL